MIRIRILLVVLALLNTFRAQAADPTEAEKKRIYEQVNAAWQRIKQVEAKLRSPEYYAPVAQRLALYCQSDPKLFPERLTSAWFPEPAADLLDGDGWVNPRGADIEFGGGFYHFGYSLKGDGRRSTRAKKVWNLYLYREDRAPILLTSVTLKPAAQVTAGELPGLIEGGFDRQISAGKAYAYCEKVAFQLRTGRIAVAEETCRQWIQAKPESWQARLALTHVRCRANDSETAATDLVGWVKAHQNFAYWSYVALFALREQKVPMALDAVRAALKQPFIEPPGTEGNRYYLGTSDAVVAFGNGDYDLCLAMCEKMLEATPQEAWWRRSTLRVKAGALAMKGDAVAAQSSMEDVKKVAGDHADNPAFAAADQPLAAAIARKDISYLRNWRNWVDTVENWFDPFQETGESRFFYPESWKGDTINPKAEGSEVP